MAENSFHVEIRKIIDKREEIVAKLDTLVETSGEDVKFVKNPDRSIACCVKYRGYEIATRLTVDEVFERTMQRGKNISDTIHDILRENICKELLVK